MLNFEKRIGPDFGQQAPVYPSTTVPQWYQDAKLGFFIHWGLYSVPAWGTPPSEDPVPTEDAYAYHQYAEWYGNTVRIPGSPTWLHQQEVYGTGTSYEDFADRWDVGSFDARTLVGQLVDAGAQYIVPTTKHHEGFCLWDTATTGFNAKARGPRRDLIAEIAAATRELGARFGVYFSGALDWHVSDFPPIESDTDLFRFRRNDEQFAQYAAAQLRELIERFGPDILWNDIDWPDGGKGCEPWAVASLLDEYFAQNPEGVINDRWGVPHHGYLTREYRNIDEIIPTPWESTRGLGYSFGYNQSENEEHSLTGDELVRLLIDVVAKNGNLLINVGPRADGSIPELQAQAMAQLGDWLRVNGEGIYGTRPWGRFGEQTAHGAVAYTVKGADVYVHALDPSSGTLCLPEELLGKGRASWLLPEGANHAQVGASGVIEIPAVLHEAPAAVLKLGGAL
ncbi:alpha-L-fucosidase [Arthrobacter sp. 179]|uniref:alpha-L-fucosidase n=1 Tax=Arthrobacter sp. 179 TaxID=3457734 RepID=UPI004033291E